MKLLQFLALRSIQDACLDQRHNRKQFAMGHEQELARTDNSNHESLFFRHYMMKDLAGLGISQPDDLIRTRR